MSEIKDKAFGVLQRIGRSFMLPIAILPIAGLFLGIGSSFTNETMLASYNLTGIIHQGTFLYSLLNVMNEAGTVIFDNLALLFAMGVAIGMAKKEKEVAALSGAVAFLVMNKTIEAMIVNMGGTENMLENSTAQVLGITTLQMGVFGGIIVGLGVAALHNRFYKVQFPQLIAFFGGTRFVPIISAVVYVAVGILLFYVWPIIQRAISMLGGLVLSSGYFGTWLYGIIERALIPFGLHHVFYIPFWQTSVGGSQVIDGVLVQGAQNIFFAELASKNTVTFNPEATRFMSGKFPFMIFGLPGAALAMYHCSKTSKKKVAGGLLLSAALTSMLTGITEPLEFTFIFAAPLMYGVHCVLAGLSFMLMHIFKVGVGMTFSGGLIDLFLFGILQGNHKTHWLYIVFVGIAYFIIYYFIFKYMIKKFNYQTPGRESDNQETKLYTRADMENLKNPTKTAVGTEDLSEENYVSLSLIKGLGGTDNIADIDCCATRLRITVKDNKKISETEIKKSNPSGIITKGTGVQIIFGPKVSVIKSNLEDFIDKNPNKYQYIDLPDDPAVHNTVINTNNGVTSDLSDLKNDTAVQNTKSPLVVTSPMTGTVVPLDTVDDDVFSRGILGFGVAIEPSLTDTDQDNLNQKNNLNSNNKTNRKSTMINVYSPTDGIVSNTFKTGHAIGITTKDNRDILIHVGIDTVKLEGRYFKYAVNQGDSVSAGDLLLSFDAAAIKDAGYKLTTPIIITDAENESSIKIIAKPNCPINKGDNLFTVD